MRSANDLAPSATGGRATRTRTQKILKKKDVDDAPLSAAQAAALDEPMTKLAGAQCLLGISGIYFGSKLIVPAATVLGKHSNLPESELLTGSMEFVAAVHKPDAAGNKKAAAAAEKKPRPAKRMTPYYLFVSYAMKELYKHKDLPVMRRFLAEHGDSGNIDMKAANTLWASLPAEDKERAGAILKPFLDAVDGERQALRSEGAVGAAAGGGVEAVAGGGLMFQRYQQYLLANPEASLIRLLRLDGNTEGLGARQEVVPPAAAAVPRKSSAAGAPAAARGGTNVMEVEERSSDDDDGESEDDDESKDEFASAGSVSEDGKDEDEEDEGAGGSTGRSSDDSSGSGQGDSEAGAAAVSEEGDATGDGDDVSTESSSDDGSGTGSDDEEGGEGEGASGDKGEEGLRNGGGAGGDGGDGGSGGSRSSSEEEDKSSGSDSGSSGSSSDDDDDDDDSEGDQAVPAPVLKRPAITAPAAAMAGGRGAPPAAKKAKK